MKQFTIVHVNGLVLNDVYALAKSTTEIANPVKTSIGELGKAALTEMETAVNALGVQLNKTQKNILSEQIEEKDLDRDNRWAEIKGFVSMYRKGRDANKKAAAKALYIFMKPYWSSNRDAFNTETAEIKDMYTKLNADATLKAHATSLGIITMLNELDTVNTEFDTLYKTRNTQEGLKNDAPSASNLKSAVVSSYNTFCAIIEQTTNLMPTLIVTTLFGQMEELRGKYAVLDNDNKKPEPISTEA